MDKTSQDSRNHGLRAIITSGFSAYYDRRVLILFLLGVSAGLPLPLLYGTPSIWLLEQGLKSSEIPLLSAVLSVYTVKFLWAPLADHMYLPRRLLRFGRRRCWMLGTQCVAAISLLILAFSNPAPGHMLVFIAGIWMLGIASATQDIALDAYRIEAAPPEMQGSLTASYVLGYRIAWQLIGGAGTLLIAESLGWTEAYCVMAGAMGIGALTVLFLCTNEDLLSPDHNSTPPSVRREKKRLWRVKLASWLRNALIKPFRDFIERLGPGLTILVLIFVLCFRLGDLLVGSISNLFYTEIGFDKADIASVTKLFGFPMLLLGAGLGGAVVRAIKIRRALVPAALFALLTNLGFAILAVTGPSREVFILVIAFDNLAGGFATAAFIAFLSSLTTAYSTATQYALLSSLMVQGKLLGVFSGKIAALLGWDGFFLLTAMLGAPAVILSVILLRWQRRSGWLM